MDSKNIEYSPLQGLEGINGINVCLVEEKYAKIIVRGKSSNSKFLSAIKKATNLSLPTKPWSVSKSNEITIFWLSPDEWLIRLADGKQDEMLNILKDELDGLHSAVINVSDYYLSLKIYGDKVIDVLEKGCVVNLNDDAFPIGYATSTNYEKAIIHLHRSNSFEFEITVRQSFATYLWKHLVVGSKEFC